MSSEKIDILKAIGAEVIITPTNVEPEAPRSYYSVSRRLAEEIPNSWFVNQYDNPSNTSAHYETTGPEIWKQTEGKITHLVVGVAARFWHDYAICHFFFLSIVYSWVVT